MQTLPPPKWRQAELLPCLLWGCLFSFMVAFDGGSIIVRGLWRYLKTLNSWLSLEIFLGCIPMLSVRGDEGTPGTHLSGDLSLSSKVYLVAYQSNHDFIGKESLLQLLQPQLCSAECLLERWRQNHSVIWF